MSRIDDLLNATAAELEDGYSPLRHEFLVEHQVTSSECLDLAEQIAIACRAWAAMTVEDKAVAIVRVECGPELANAFAPHVGMAKLRREREARQ